MKTITISSKNQVVIPSSVRKTLGVKGGDKLIIEKVTENEVILKKEPRYKDLIGTLKAKQEDPVKRIRELRDKWV